MKLYNMAFYFTSGHGRGVWTFSFTDLIKKFNKKENFCFL